MRISLSYWGLGAINKILVRNLKRKTGNEKLFHLQVVNIFIHFIKTITQKELEAISK